MTGGNATHAGLLLLLGLSRVVASGGSTVSLDELAVGLGFREFARDSLASTPARLPLEPPLLLRLFLIGRLRDLDDHSATIELLLVEELDGLLRGLCGVQGDKAVACGASATQDDLGSETGRKLLFRPIACCHEGARLTCRPEQARRTPSALHPW